jgi:hypothetical protein
MKSLSVALLLLGAFAGAPSDVSAAGSNGPWLDPANAEQCVFVGKDV